MEDLIISSIVHLNIGGNKCCTTVGTLTRHEPSSMLLVMFGERHVVHQDPEKGYVFTDWDGTHFRHIVNWLRDGVLPSFDDDSKYSELLREADYYQLLLRDGIHAFLDKRKEDDLHTEKLDAELMLEKLGFKVLTFSGLNLSRLNFTNADFSYACLTNVRFLGCDLRGAFFNYVGAEGAVFENASLQNSSFIGANLLNALFVDVPTLILQTASMVSAQLADANLRDAFLV
ncbi:FH protein interacting protein FIP2-like [Pyrus ussuriensis x Pyrus communis]|uniref:FH protein interacting protein FIP2-like n=1 Tax=Pyrus ussuriensis x Pyrus communis TaxID=2448454 RepID=A0A5N5I7J0_9ROSA|nr:FH protein interacting protein FIP2-like [Pyrus ussuriensis x Pyrus communis]